MRRSLPFWLLLLGLCLHRGPAEASGDFMCFPSWTLAHGELTDCDNMAVLAPGNDTRVNLILLLQDLRGGPTGSGATSPAASPASPDPLFDLPTFESLVSPKPAGGEEQSDSYAEGEGSRCRSNAAGIAAFEAAIAAAGTVPEVERTALIAARNGLAPSCTGVSGGAEAVAQAAQQATSPAGKAYATYLQGTQAFYDGDYDTARSAFTGLTGSDDAWLAETARYMLGRVEVNRAQIDAFDEYGYPKPENAVDPKVIDAAEAGLLDYLKAYPDGQYANSARGLLRRVYWLGARPENLAETYATLFNQDPAARGLGDVDLANEIDNKLLLLSNFTTTTDPTLLAVLDLRGMRDGKASAPADALDGQSGVFSANPALLEFLKASRAFYIEKQPAEVLKLIAAAAPATAMTTLEFSRQMLRGMALEATQDAAAREHWTSLIGSALQPLQRTTVELALALHDERAGALDKVFAPDSPIRNATMREILLRNVADAKLLRQQATAAAARERDVALFTLLYKELSRERYADFLKDLALIPAGDAQQESTADIGAEAEPLPPLQVFGAPEALGDYDCGALKATAARLAKNARDSRALLCLADYFRANGFDQYEPEEPLPAGELGGTPPLFKGKPYARLEVYKAVIASAKTPAADLAYALYRAVNCYAPSGYNSCGGVDVPVSQRKAWFQQLKRNYPKSRWAKALQYYW